MVIYGRSLGGSAHIEKAKAQQKALTFPARRGGTDLDVRAAVALLITTTRPAFLSTARFRSRQQTDEGMRKGSAKKIHQHDVETETASAG